MGATVAFLPSCVYRQDQVHMQLKHLQINPDQEKLLASLADEIIPATQTPGATDLGLHFFALKMVDDCYDSVGRDQFMSGFKAFAENRSADNALTLEKAAADQKMAGFVNGYRSLIVRGYKQSEYYMTKVVPYKLVPGGYKGCIPVTAAATT
ncbi:hypothetical protein FPE01S_06_00200 [Flavihumibacter petaseus NBRC 106054]|uniref:Gluconate 2-dehydrogenase subunit 3 family protein n=2 Tax=Flavihumibacter TaxID=1004301 RepID=A0A0E9N6S7_9BACT|nr:hypothetical protein FPE01S_06_00200 [Flavihumibacter petaseus NBRC 106054]